MQNELQRPKAKPLPTLLTKSDAMLFAADALDQLVSNMGLVSIFADALKRMPAGGASESDRQSRDEIRTIASGIIDKDIQVAAMRDAATEIRALAQEQKLIEARSAMAGGRITA